MLPEMAAKIFAGKEVSALKAMDVVEKKCLSPEMVHKAFNKAYKKENLEQFCNRKFKSHPDLGNRMRDAEKNNESRSFSTDRGRLLEDYVKDICKDIFDCKSSQTKVALSENQATIVDLQFVAKKDVCFAGKTIKAGEEVSVEVKTGSKNYLRQEFKSGHIEKQVEGHLGKHSITFVSKDFNDLPLKTQKEIRDGLSGKTTIMSILPKVEIIDKNLKEILSKTSQFKLEE